MKMTRAEWRYLQKIALDHPYYDTHKLPLTEAEAKAIVKANNVMTGREFVDSIYEKLGMTRPPREKKRFERLRGVAGLFFVPMIRRIAIAVLVIILITVFFAATPTGRAIAEEVRQYVVRLFDKNAVGSRESEETPLRFSEADLKFDELPDGADSVIRADSFEAFTKETGKTPVVLPLPCEWIEYDLHDGVTLHATYIVSGTKIHTNQWWEFGEEIITTCTRPFQSHPLHESVYYSVDETDGTVYCIVSMEDSELLVVAQRGVDIDELITLIAEAL